MKRLLTHIIPLTCLAALGIALHSCTKTPDDPPKPPVNTECDTCLPLVTTTGKGTFGCKVNGKIWLPKGTWGYPASGLSYSNATLSIYGYNDTYKERIGFSFATIIDTGFFDFSTNPFSYSNAGFSNIINQSDKYKSEPVTLGFLKLMRFEPTTSGIVSGIFAFDVYNTNGDTMHITEGRFDLRF